MFILRTIHTNQNDPSTVEENLLLGKNYSVIKRGHPDFIEFMDDYEKEEKSIYAMIVSEDNEPIPLYKLNYYYVMTTEGKTFSKLSSITHDLEDLLKGKL